MEGNINNWLNRYWIIPSPTVLSYGLFSDGSTHRHLSKNICLWQLLQRPTTRIKIQGTKQFGTTALNYRCKMWIYRGYFLPIKSNPLIENIVKNLLSKLSFINLKQVLNSFCTGDNLIKLFSLSLMLKMMRFRQNV